MSDTPHVADLVDDFAHSLLTPESSADVERHCADCDTCRDALEQARTRLAALKAIPPVEPSPALVENTLRGVKDQAPSGRQAAKRVMKWLAWSAAAAALVLCMLQIYCSLMKPTPYDLVVLGQTDLLTAATNSLRVQIMNRQTEQPVAGVPVTLLLQPVAGGDAINLVSCTTDANGIGQPSFTLPDATPGAYDLTVKADVAGSEEKITQRVQLKRSWLLLLTSDKPVYQPGQTIHMRALALRQPAGKPVAEETATISVVDPKNNVVFKQEGKTSRFGITSADCVLADELTTGRYTLVCRVGDTESRMAVSVSKYVLPKIKLNVEFDRAFYSPRDKALCTIHGDYFFGKPVADAEVKIEVNGLLVATGFQPVNPVPDGGKTGWKPVATKVRTTANGEAVVPLDIAALVKELKLADDTKLKVTVTLTDAAKQVQTRTVERLVTKQPIRIEIIPEGGTLVQGVPNTVYVLTTTADGKPASVPLHVSGDVNLDMNTSDLGVGSFVVKPDHGSINWSIEALGRNGETLAERDDNLTCGDRFGDFLLRTDRAVYRGGQSMTLSALGGGSGPICVDFFKTDGVRRTILSTSIAMHDGCGEQVVDLPSDLKGAVQICAYRLATDGERHTQIVMERSRAIYVRPPQELEVRMTPASGAKEYRPRSTEQVRLALTDAAGKPTVGALSVAVVDESVFSVASGDTLLPAVDADRDLLAPVYARYPWSPNLEKRLGNEHAGELEQALFAATIKRNGDGPIAKGSSDVADHTMLRDTYPTKVDETMARRGTGRKILFCCWILMLFGAGILAYASLWVFMHRVDVVRLHWTFLLMLSPFVFLVCLIVLGTTGLGENASNTFSYVSGQSKAKSDPVVLIDESRSTGKDIDGDTRIFETWHDDKDMPQGQGRLREPTYIRDQFPETLAWRPQIITDDTGHASVDLDFKDSITTWRFAASAIDADGRLGSGEMPLRVVKPFFVDFNLPVSLTRKDEVAVPVVIHNYTDKPQTVTLTLTDADWFKRSGGPDQPLVVQPGKVAAANYRITAQRVGMFILKVRAAGQNVVDAVERPIEIVPDGERIDMPPANGYLDRPARVALTVPDNVIDGSMHAQVKLFPNTFSQILDGLEGIFQMPHGCFEQTSSSTYPNVLALDYLKQTGQSRPQLEEKAQHFIHVGYQRLLTFEVAGGGFDWYGRGPAIASLTAYGLMEFEDMARVHAVDPKLIERTRRWLMAQRQPNGSWTSSPGFHCVDDADAHFATTAYIAWAVFAHGAEADHAKRTLDFLVRRPARTIKDPYTLALLCNALLELDPTKAEPYLDRLDALRKTDANRLSWWPRGVDERTLFYGAGDSADVETTALAALALVKAKRPGPVAGALSWLTSRKQANGTWGSTQATILAFKALLAGTHVGNDDKERVIEVKLGNKLIRTLKVPPSQAEVMQVVPLTPYLAAGNQILTLTSQSGPAGSYQVTLRFHVDHAAAPKIERPLSIELKYDRTTLAIAEVVRVKATVANWMPQSAEMVMIELPVPPGFAPVTDALEALRKQDRIAKYSVGAGKIIVYVRELEREPLVMEYGLQALQSVKTQCAGARVWEYYAPEREAKTAGVTLTVKP